MKRKIYQASVIVAMMLAACNPQNEVEPVTDATDEFGASTACNCVLYARSRQPKLPYGLTSYQDKKNEIDVYKPQVGAVAVMPGGDARYGHVSYVAKVNADGTIVLDEANWKPCQITTNVKVTPSSRGIVGYILY